MNPRQTGMAIALLALALTVSVVVIMVGRDSAPAGVAAPCEGGACEPRDVSGLALFSTLSGGAAYEPENTAGVEDVLEKGLALAEASPVHLAFRGTAQSGSVRCEWRGVARTPAQREEAIRFWLGLNDSDPLPSAAEVERRFMAELDVINPIYPGTVRSNFLAIARGGVSTEYMFLTCFADYTVQEYLLGPSVTGTPTLTVAYDRLGEVRSYELYKLAHDRGEFGDEALMSEGEYEDYLDQPITAMEAVMSVLLSGRESVVFLAPMGAHNTIAVEAWQVVDEWDLQKDENDVVHAVRYGAPENDPERTQTLANLRSRITAATAPPSSSGDAAGTSLGTPGRSLRVGGRITTRSGLTAP